MRVIARDARQPIESEIVLSRRRIAVPRLQEADDVFVEMRPPALVRALTRVLRERRRFAVLRHREIARQQVVQRRNVRRALDRRVAAQRHDAAARTADVAEQQLQNRGRANRLGAGGMLREADRVADRARALRTRRAREAIGQVEKRRDRHAARLRDHLWRVAREVPDELLIHRSRMRQRRVASRSSVFVTVVLPGRDVVPLRLGVPS